MRYIVPNSRINAMKLTNYSYHRSGRSAKFLFSVGYDTDLELAKRVIQKAIADCPLTTAGFTDDQGLPSYGRVYFVKFDSSALILQTTVIYESRVPSERLIDAVNCSVREALINNGIEIPYDYVNVINESAQDGR
jgi:small-conductance mechanosensitive channel